MLKICRPCGAWPGLHDECYKYAAPAGLDRPSLNPFIIRQ
ncbi:Uncharacterized protein dnm_091400 [Desulfonema magnum]|uniref:Uncharacterized protein n=1 Tax=Desulfonema magnum TaxID=45655 RepID=A0A975GTE7_9BACT|nr:Uncharacterized protein dnm_091400 [Desulfonema magnum]